MKIKTCLPAYHDLDIWYSFINYSHQFRYTHHRYQGRHFVYAPDGGIVYKRLISDARIQKKKEKKRIK